MSRSAEGLALGVAFLRERGLPWPCCSKALFPSASGRFRLQSLDRLYIDQNGLIKPVIGFEPTTY
jgi:hypothetical protein